MIPWTHALVWTPPLVNAAAILWVRVQLDTIPTHGPFLLSRGMPFVGRPQRIVPFLAGAAGCALAAWSTGFLVDSEGLVLLGLVLWVCSLLIAGLLGFLLRVQLRRETRRLTVTGAPKPSLILEGAGETLRIDLANDGVLGWSVEAAPYIQLRVQDASGSSLALFISPESRHLALIAEAPMLDGYEGWSPITRGPELLDVLSPFIVPGG
jgi:hypothetical protein